MTWSLSDVAMVLVLHGLHHALMGAVFTSGFGRQSPYVESCKGVVVEFHGYGAPFVCFMSELIVSHRSLQPNSGSPRITVPLTDAMGAVIPLTEIPLQQCHGVLVLAL